MTPGIGAGKDAAGNVAGFRIEGAKLGSDAAFRAFAEAVKDIFDVALAEPGIPSPAVQVDAWHLGTVMLGRFSGPALLFDRPPPLVARSGLDHFLVQIYAEGGFSGTAGGNPIIVERGDLCVFDLTDTFSTRSSQFTNYSLLIPRDAMAGEVDDLRSLHGMVIPARTPLAGLLAEYFVSLSSRATLLDAREALLAAEATVSLATTIVAGAVGENSTKPGSGDRGSPLRQVNDYIDANIENPDLGAGAITRALGMSRASLYRLLASSGGVGRYIRRRRLNGAALDLSHPTRRVRIGEIAMRWGFLDNASFSRAFRQEFGMAPRAARGRKAPFPPVEGNSSAQNVTGLHFGHWMRDLRASRTGSRK